MDADQPDWSRSPSPEWAVKVEPFDDEEVKDEHQSPTDPPLPAPPPKPVPATPDLSRTHPPPKTPPMAHRAYHHLALTPTTSHPASSSHDKPLQPPSPPSTNSEDPVIVCRPQESTSWSPTSPPALRRQPFRWLSPYHDHGVMANLCHTSSPQTSATTLIPPAIQPDDPCHLHHNLAVHHRHHYLIQQHLLPSLILTHSHCHHPLLLHQRLILTASHRQSNQHHNRSFHRYHHSPPPRLQTNRRPLLLRTFCVSPDALPTPPLRQDLPVRHDHLNDLAAATSRKAPTAIICSDHLSVSHPMLPNLLLITFSFS